MKYRSKINTLLIGIFTLMASYSSVAAEPTESVDANAAIKLAKSQSCLRCHGVTKKKEGPPYVVIAAFYKSNKDAEEVIYEHITTGPKVKLTDGHSEKHKAILDKNPDQIMNLVRWILAQ
jgi:cytochrome c